LKELSKTGNFANVDVVSDLKSDDLNVSIRDFQLSPSLDRVDFNLNVSGNVDADMNVKFVPLGIVGHLTCQMPWQQTQHFVAGFRESKIPVNLTVSIDTTSGKPKITFVIDEMTVKGSISPSPTEFLLTSPNIAVSCTGLNMIKPLVVRLTPFIKELRGDIDRKIERQESSTEIALPTAKFEGFGLQTSATTTPQALVLTGNLVSVIEGN